MALRILKTTGSRDGQDADGTGAYWGTWGICGTGYRLQRVPRNSQPLWIRTRMVTSGRWHSRVLRNEGFLCISQSHVACGGKENLEMTSILYNSNSDAGEFQFRFWFCKLH